MCSAEHNAVGSNIQLSAPEYCHLTELDVAITSLRRARGRDFVMEAQIYRIVSLGYTENMTVEGIDELRGLLKRLILCELSVYDASILDAAIYCTSALRLCSIIGWSRCRYGWPYIQSANFTLDCRHCCLGEFFLPHDARDCRSPEENYLLLDM
jgi:hypothetical protein